MPSDLLKPLLHVVHIYVPAPAQTEQYLSSQDAHPAPLSYCPLGHASMQKLWLTITSRHTKIYIYIYILLGLRTQSIPILPITSSPGWSQRVQYSAFVETYHRLFWYNVSQVVHSPSVAHAVQWSAQHLCESSLV